MNNSLGDTDGFEDPDAYKIDEVPKTLNYSPSVPYAAQVITVSRILDLSGGNEDVKWKTEPNVTFQSEKSTEYKYAFGSRVQTEKGFDKGLGVIGVGRGGIAQSRATDYSQNQDPVNIKSKTKQRAPGTQKAKKKVLNKGPISKPKRDENPYIEEEKKEPQSSAKKDRTPLEIELENQKHKVEKQFNLVNKEENKLEAIKQKRKKLFSNPFKVIWTFLLFFLLIILMFLLEFKRKRTTV